VQPLSVGDQSVMSGIRKRPVAGVVAVDRLGLEGDEQADLTVHGGLSKAIYAYPVEHYGFWREQKRSWGLPEVTCSNFRTVLCVSPSHAFPATSSRP
jgi:MOSC domain-containing protein YiiM